MLLSALVSIIPVLFHSVTELSGLFRLMGDRVRQNTALPGSVFSIITQSVYCLKWLSDTIKTTLFSVTQKTGNLRPETGQKLPVLYMCCFIHCFLLAVQRGEKQYPGLPGYHQCARFQWKAESYLDGCPAPPALFE